MLNLDKTIDELVSLQRQKYDGLLKILDLTKEQHNTILDFNIEKLNELIELRQKEIDSLEKLDREYSLIIEDIKSEYNVESLSEVKVLDNSLALELDKISEGIKKTMRDLDSYEQENHKILEEQKNEFGSKIKQINRGKKAEKMYQSKGYVQPVFYDKKTHY